jgi:N-acetylmuramoyl-L-alanine amidase
MKIAISSGHGKYIRGASGSPVPPQLDEVNEARKVVDRVAVQLASAGVGVVKFHDDTSHSQNENLNTIVAWHNKQSRDYDVSVHFNAYNHSAHGTEVLYVSQEKLAKKVCDAIVGAGHFTNRGAKYNGGLAFLNGTNKPAILLEVCFCDNTDDSNLYNQHFEAICEAIAESVGGAQVPDERPPTQPPEPEPPPAELHVSVAITAPPGVIVNVTQSVSGSQDISVLKK